VTSFATELATPSVTDVRYARTDTLLGLINKDDESIDIYIYILFHARAWNSLPTRVTTATSLTSFKKQLKTFLFTKSFPEF